MTLYIPCAPGCDSGIHVRSTVYQIISSTRIPSLARLPLQTRPIAPFDFSSFEGCARDLAARRTALRRRKSGKRSGQTARLPDSCGISSRQDIAGLMACATCVLWSTCRPSKATFTKIIECPAAVEGACGTLMEWPSILVVGWVAAVWHNSSAPTPPGTGSCFGTVEAD